MARPDRRRSPITPNLGPHLTRLVEHHGTAADADGALQPERTALAWSRTFLACLTVTVVMVKYAPSHGPILMLLPVLTAAAAVGISASQRIRTRESVNAIRDDRRPRHAGSLMAMLGLCMSIATVGIVLVLA